MPSKNHNIVLEVAYDGTRYLGWQKTHDGPSIEEELEKALTTILQHTIVLQATSRTDRGVHATGQIVNFFTEKTLDLLKLQHSLLQLLPDDIAILSIQEAAFEFHPTLHSTAKEYRYHIANTPILLPKQRFTYWHIKQPLNKGEMKKALDLLKGTHDFKAFCNFRKGLNYTSTIRTITSAELVEEAESGHFYITFTGDHFLYKMVRNLVGTCVYVGLGKLRCEDLPRILESQKRAEAGITAPAHGLTLHKIFLR